MIVEWSLKGDILWTRPHYLFFFYISSRSSFLSDVCTKYQEAAKIVNLTLEGLVGQCIPGAKVLDLCEFGHTVMEASAAKLYTKKVDGKMVDRGVAFPICISVNDIVCNHSPLPTEETVGAFYHCDLLSCLVKCRDDSLECRNGSLE